MTTTPATMRTLSPSQLETLSTIISVTKLERSVALQLLHDHLWNAQAALNAFFDAGINYDVLHEIDSAPTHPMIAELSAETPKKPDSTPKSKPTGQINGTATHSTKSFGHLGFSAAGLKMGGGDQTYKEGSPIIFSNAAGPVPPFQLNAALTATNTTRTTRNPPGPGSVRLLKVLRTAYTAAKAVFKFVLTSPGIALFLTLLLIIAYKTCGIWALLAVIFRIIAWLFSWLPEWVQDLLEALWYLMLAEIQNRVCGE